MSVMKKHGLWADVREAKETGCLQVHFFQSVAPRVGGGACVSMSSEDLGKVSWTEATAGYFPQDVMQRFSAEEIEDLYRELLGTLLDPKNLSSPRMDGL